MKKITLIAAMTSDGTIGKDNAMLWHISNDLKRFKKLTLNNTVIMGRKTYDSIPSMPLKNRRNLVMTKSKIEIPGVKIINSLNMAMEELDPIKENFIIGGSQIYRMFIKYAQKIYITQVYKYFEGDRFFPHIDKNIWMETSNEFIENDSQTEFDYSFKTYKRTKENIIYLLRFLKWTNKLTDEEIEILSAEYETDIKKLIMDKRNEI